MHSMRGKKYHLPSCFLTSISRIVLDSLTRYCAESRPELRDVFLFLSRLTFQVTFDPVYGMLNGLNVGDSGALLVRR